MRCLWMEVTSSLYRQSLSRGDCVPPRYKPGAAFGHTRFDIPLACARRKRLWPPRPQVKVSSPGACPGTDFIIFFPPAAETLRGRVTLRLSTRLGGTTLFFGVNAVYFNYKFTQEPWVGKMHPTLLWKREDCEHETQFKAPLYRKGADGSGTAGRVPGGLRGHP